MAIQNYNMNEEGSTILVIRAALKPYNRAVEEGFRMEDFQHYLLRKENETYNAIKEHFEQNPLLAAALEKYTNMLIQEGKLYSMFNPEKNIRHSFLLGLNEEEIVYESTTLRRKRNNNSLTTPKKLYAGKSLEYIVRGLFYN